jgi:hypothetical protein
MKFETPQGSDPRRMQIGLTTAGRTEEGTASATPASVASSGGDRYATRVKASAMRRRDARFAGDKMTVPARVNSYARVGKAGGTDTQQHSTAGRPYDSLQYGRVAEVDAPHTIAKVRYGMRGRSVRQSLTCRYRILPRPKTKKPGHYQPGFSRRVRRLD